MRYALLLSYDGTLFSGWQKQKKGERTVQGVLEDAAEKIFGEQTAMHASGRTDAGVHALGQVVSFDAETTVPAQKLRECFNRLLPPDCKVLCSARAPDGFDPTGFAKQKIYRYTAYHAETEMPMLRRYAARLAGVPDLGRMREGGRLLTGEHDFAAFSATGSSVKTTVRTIERIEISCKDEGPAEIFSIEVTGNGFLYNMVRILAGELFAVGCGKEPVFIERALATGRRELLAKTMAPEGLTLVSVDYGFPLFGNREE